MFPPAVSTMLALLPSEIIPVALIPLAEVDPIVTLPKLRYSTVELPPTSIPMFLTLLMETSTAVVLWRS